MAGIVRKSSFKRVWRVYFPVLLVILGIALSCGDNPTEPGPPPQITLFSANPTDIAPGDSSLVTYKARYTRTLRLYPSGQSLTPLDSGSLYLKPSIPQTYHLVATNDEGIDSAGLEITMSSVMAQFSQFSITENRILIGDSTLLAWNVQQADSIVVDNGVGRLPDPVSGSIWIMPAATTTYRAIAYNIGQDTAEVTVVVEVPVQVDAPEGFYYKSEMGSAVQAPPMEFVVLDQSGGADQLSWIHFEMLEGDGVLSDDSLLPGVAGAVYPTYEFSGSMGHASIRAKVKGVDSIDVTVRANTIVPGLGGQGQYIRFADTYAMVQEFNGAPESVDGPFDGLHYVVYEQSLGVVVMVIDSLSDGQIFSAELVYGVILNTVYDETTAEGIGVGSHILDVIAAYGQPDSVRLDPTPPPADLYRYLDPPMDFFADPTDSIVFEIHVTAPLADGAPALNAGNDVVDGSGSLGVSRPASRYRQSPAATR